jgi:isochorismate synthase
MSAVFSSADFSGIRHRLLAAGRRAAARRGHAMLVSSSLPFSFVEPAALFAQASTAERIFWEQPSRGFSLAAFGAATWLFGHGAARFSRISTGWRRLVSQALVDAVPSCPLLPPVSLGGFAFDAAPRKDSSWKDYPDALLVVPRFLFLSYQGSSWLIVNALITVECDASALIDEEIDFLSELMEKAQAATESSTPALVVQHDEARDVRWKETVAQLAQAVAHGALEKLVLARQVSLHAAEPIHPGAVIQRLRGGYEHCTIFAFAANHSCFVGATPERLVRLDNGHAQADCLAGSARRGATPDEDRRIGEALRTDPKERREHELVLNALHQRLAPFCTQLTSPEEPNVLRLPNVQHLHTPVEGALKETDDIFALVEALHPTPATGGLPRAMACSLLQTHEDFERGWYAAPVGWVDGHGNGEFVVAIRSALLHAQGARLFAGCGIVAGSDPEREYQESCLKLQPMLWALNGKEV